MLQIFHHVVFFATSRGKFFNLTREIILLFWCFDYTNEINVEFLLHALDDKKKVSLAHNSLMTDLG